MNYVMISPSYPQNFKHFTVALKNEDVIVLGIGDAAYDLLDPELRDALTEYYLVESMEDYDQMFKAVSYFAWHYGKIDRIESHNEHWLETEARLRTDFNVRGLKNEDMERIKRKSGMKKTFRKAKLRVAPGGIVHTIEEAEKFIKRHKYPVVIKPDSGAGAADVIKICDSEALESFFEQQDRSESFIERFIEGTIHTFDGLTDQEGNIVFYSSSVYGQGVMETLAQDLERTFHISRKFHNGVVESGIKAIETFRLNERFFHLEMIVTPENEVYALELNARPPGGWMLDMVNYANDLNIYSQYARIVSGKKFEAEDHRKYNCYYVGRKAKFDYAHTVDEIQAAYPDEVVQLSPVDTTFSSIIGDYSVIFRTEHKNRGTAIEKFVLAKRSDT